MRTKIILFAIVTTFAAASALAEQAQAPAASQVKSRVQIRCELMGQCDVTRSVAEGLFITKTGGVIKDPKAIARAVASTKAEYDSRKSAAKAPTGGHKSKLIWVPSSDLFINFATASWRIEDTAFEQAAELYAAIRPEEWSAHKFEISGHTDAVGGPDYNVDLSKKRAQAVVDLLVARGVSRSQLVVKGYGYNHPIEGLERNDGRNRRVEIKKLD